MRAKRSKQYRKLMRQYELLGFRTPYQVLIDAQLIRDAAKSKLHLGNLVSGALGGAEIKPMITQCCIRHLYNTNATTDAERGDKEAWIEVAKAAERRRCGHHELQEPLSTLECLMSVVDPKGSGNNRHRYVVASQEGEVRARMRRVVGVPLVYLKRSVMILEPMGEATERVREREEREKVRAGLKGRRGERAGEKRKREDDDKSEDGGNGAREVDAPVQKKFKAKGPKGPNPLSVKKAKKERPAKTVAREMEYERATIRKAKKDDPQADEKALDAELAIEGQDVNGTIEAPRKRKRKRKPAEEGEAVSAMVQDVS